MSSIRTWIISVLTTASPLALALAPGAALAQASPPTGQLEELIVTAQRREQKLSDVPISVTAIDRQQIERSQIVDVRALQALAPNLTVTPAFLSSADLIVSSRGVQPASFNTNADPTVGIYVNGVYYARTQGTNLGFVDMERVEVLHGPQGTLFGRNTIGGTVSITTRAPTNDFEGLVKIGVGNYDTFTANAVLNVPLVADRVSARLVFDHQQHDGYGYNTQLDVPLSDQNQYYFRASLRAQISDNARLDLVGDYFHSESNPQLWVLRYSDPTIAPAALNAQTLPFLCRDKCRSMGTDFNQHSNGEAYTLAATATVDVGAVTLTSITGYRYIDFGGGADIDGTPLRIAGSIIYTTANQFSQEFQVSGKSLDDRLDWIVGAYYFNEHVYSPSMNQFSVAIAGAFVPALSVNKFWGYNRSVSAFGQFSYEIFPKVRFTAGARYNEDRRRAAYNNPTFTAAGVRSAVGPLPSCRLPVEFLAPNTAISSLQCTYTPPGVKFHFTPWTLGLDYKPREGSLFFAKVSKGYRSGGFQTSLGSPNPILYHSFGPENVVSYDLGTKLTLLDNRLRIGLTGFYAKYNEIQQNTPLIDPRTNTPIFDFNNAGTARVYGLEFEASALIGPLRLNGTLGLTDPKFTSGLYAAAQPPELRGTSVGVSETNWSISAEYPINLSEGVLTLHADYGYQSNRYDYPPANTNFIPFRALNPQQLASVRTNGISLLNAQARFEFATTPLTLIVWGRNLTDDYSYVRSLSTYTAGSNAGLVSDPRTFGATVQYVF